MSDREFDYHGLTIGKLAQALSTARPEDELHRNQVGNLAIYRGGEYVGYVDLGIGEVVYLGATGEETG